MDTTSEGVCYVHCNFCNTILVVSIPCTSLYNTLTIRCGHCSNFLYVNMGSALQQTVHPQGHQKQNSPFQEYASRDHGSSSKCNKVSVLASSGNNQAASRVLPTASPQKRQRVPSAYNRFIKEEIQRIKANNPDITHKQAFSTAAKNWAHFPDLQFGLTLNGSDKIGEEEAISAEDGTRRITPGFY